ncbi:hypothetical protein AGDE_00017 [Angomonas deanei]|nr:hypothetical protein AGDE_00017 [Angomonas deanei]|eukprot:EPY43903.1 hypothetical protein AGDE_00017 [Angomonas deanei]
MSKDECAEVLRKSKSPSSELSTIADSLKTSLQVGSIASFEFTNKDIVALGDLYEAK